MRIVSSALLRACLAVASLAAVGLDAPPAAARCTTPRPELTPGLGAVPTNPVLRLVVSTCADSPPLPHVVARLAGRQVPVIVTPDAGAADLRAYRVAVTAATAGPLEVDVLDPAGTVLRRWTLTVDPRRQSPIASSTGEPSSGPKKNQ